MFLEEENEDEIKFANYTEWIEEEVNRATANEFNLDYEVKINKKIITPNYEELFIHFSPDYFLIWLDLDRVKVVLEILKKKKQRLAYWKKKQEKNLKEIRHEQGEIVATKSKQLLDQIYKNLLEMEKEENAKFQKEKRELQKKLEKILQKWR